MVKIRNKKEIYSLSQELPHRHVGEYFHIISFKEMYFLFYCCDNLIKVVTSDSLSFENNGVTSIIKNSPGGCFCPIVVQDKIYILVGRHGSTNGDDEIDYPDHVWPDEKRTIANWKTPRSDRQNGMYLLSSVDGKNWVEELEKPVIHGYESSESVKLGQIGFDTSPFLIKYNNLYYFYGRLNSSLDERLIYVRTSRDLKTWTKPEKIQIDNESQGNHKNNYYNPVLFEDQGFLYMFTPYFEACGTPRRAAWGGKTILMKSSDGHQWSIIGSVLPHEGKYQHRVNSVISSDEIRKVFFRQGVILNNQNFVCYDFILGDTDEK